MKYHIVKSKGIGGFGLGFWRNTSRQWTVCFACWTWFVLPKCENMEELRRLCTARFKAQKVREGE